jgi:plasmid stability protein
MGQRTTLTLEDDVVARLREEARRQGRSFKDVVNDALRSGLDRASDQTPEPYRVPVRNMGLRPGVDLDDIQALLDRLDGPGRS